MSIFYTRQCWNYLLRKTTLRLSPYFTEETYKIWLNVADELTGINPDDLPKCLYVYMRCYGNRPETYSVTNLSVGRRGTESPTTTVVNTECTPMTWSWATDMLRSKRSVQGDALSDTTIRSLAKEARRKTMLSDDGLKTPTLLADPRKLVVVLARNSGQVFQDKFKVTAEQIEIACNKSIWLKFQITTRKLIENAFSHLHHCAPRHLPVTEISLLARHVIIS